jgi:NAD(P)-dependent dehydrogenase (short-subunit alcohol dehydrogenase family)
LIKPQTLIIGANSGIAKAIADQILKKATDNLIVISRDLSFYKNKGVPSTHQIEVNDYSAISITQAVEKIKDLEIQSINRIFICHGVLHTNNIQPEKRLEDFDACSFVEVMMANALTPILWIKSLAPMLSSKHEGKITIFSARVGSISDNKLGGWYSYRASKAALNMLLKTAAIELKRRAKNIKLISFHPGTTDTELSKPFQKNVPDGKLFNGEFVAKQLISIVDNMPIDNTLSYVDWQGKEIDW